MTTHLSRSATVPAQLFSPDDLRRRLPPFAFETALPDDPLLQGYRRYYGLDFEQRINAVQAQMGQVHVAGFDIAVQSFQPAAPRGTVIVVHGYYDHTGIFDHLIEALLQQEYAVLAFDLPGHGLSSGARAAIASFHLYQPVLQKIIQLAAQAALPKPWHFAAQSTGGAIVSEYLLGFASTPLRNPFTSAVLLAPLVRPANWWRNQYAHALLSPFVASLPRKFNHNSADADFLHFSRTADPLQPRYLSTRWVGALKQWIPFLERHEPVDFPVLMIQGEQDESVDWRHNTRVLQTKFHPAELFLVADMRHQVVNEAASIRGQVFARMLAFFSRHS